MAPPTSASRGRPAYQPGMPRVHAVINASGSGDVGGGGCCTLTDYSTVGSSVVTLTERLPDYAITSAISPCVPTAGSPAGTRNTRSCLTSLGSGACP